MTYLTSQYSFWGVLISVLIGAFASYVALDLAKRVQDEDRTTARMWWAFGSIALGTGIWSMHFVGMLAFSLPIALGYTKLLTFLSWVAAVSVSAVALWVATSRLLTSARLLGGALAMGGGICAMHYIGMAALDMTIGIDWNPWLVTASALIAVSASAAALLIFFWLRAALPARALAYQAIAAVVMGVAISGMHYTAMAAANFPRGAICLSAGSLSGNTLASIVAFLSVLLLALTLFASIFDVRRRLTRSLEAANTQLRAANEELQRTAFIDPLTRMPNRKLFEDRLAHAIGRLERNFVGTTAAWRRPDVSGSWPRPNDTGVRHGPDFPADGRDKIGVLFVDLDGFKPINDSFGHAAGDKVLIEVGQRLCQAARPNDTVARLGGDEFVLLMENVEDPTECDRSANQLLEVLSAPLHIERHEVSISASVGIALYPDHGRLEDLLVHADAAMYAAKRAGGGGYMVF